MGRRPGSGVFSGGRVRRVVGGFTDRVAARVTGGLDKKTLEESIERQKRTIDDLEKREADMTKKADAEAAKAMAWMRRRDNRASNKKKAKHCLQRKRRYTKRRDVLEMQRMNVEEMYATLQQTELQMEIVAAAQQGATQLKNAHSQIGGVDRIDDVVGDVQEAIQSSAEINQALAGTFGETTYDNEVDDDFDDLEALLAEEEALVMLDLKIPTIPVVSPVVVIPVVVIPEEEEVVVSGNDVPAPEATTGGLT